jgi:heme exporter protein A
MQEADLVRIIVTDLACRRGDRVLFAGLSLDVAAGEAVQVVGENGIGKSSLLRIIAGLAPAFAGSAKVTGVAGLLDERCALDPALALGRALEFWSGIDSGPPGKPERSHLERLGLAGLLDVPVRYLSTGQKKRAALVRLLGQRAGVWLLDEPLNGLDGHAVELVEALAGEHCAAGGIALIASHQPFRLDAMRSLRLAEFSA